MILLPQACLGSESVQPQELEMRSSEAMSETASTLLDEKYVIHVEEGSTAVLECRIRNITSDLMVT